MVAVTDTGRYPEVVALTKEHLLVTYQKATGRRDSSGLSGRTSISLHRVLSHLDHPLVPDTIATSCSCKSQSLTVRVMQLPVYLETRLPVPEASSTP